VVFWVSATLLVGTDQVAREREFWGAVTGYGPSLVSPEGIGFLDVSADPGPPGVRVEVHTDGAVPAVPAPAAFPGVRRSRIYQVCVDVPGGSFESEAQRWAALCEGSVEVLARRPEFAWLRAPGGPRPLDVLLQRLDRADGATGAHLDLGTPDRAAETRRHLELGASPVADEEFWTVLADPAGLPYCITERDPATGELA
jgi:hypothetical protein